MKFCSQCGNPVTQRIPEGDSRLRFVCDSCQAIHYQNPNIVAGCVATWGTKVLLCRRAIEPRLGYWTLPAGFMENGETIEQAAIRETAEEACARVRNLSIYTLIDVPHISQVHVFFRAELVGPGFCRRSREPGSATIRRSGHSMGRAGFPHGRPYLRMLLR
jgi:ADP-ribose pyrophosphatase YjhB (NUDIX family)